MFVYVVLLFWLLCAIRVWVDGCLIADLCGLWYYALYLAIAFGVGFGVLDFCLWVGLLLLLGLLCLICVGWLGVLLLVLWLF